MNHHNIITCATNNGFDKVQLCCLTKHSGGAVVGLRLFLQLSMQAHSAYLYLDEFHHYYLKTSISINLKWQKRT